MAAFLLLSQSAGFQLSGARPSAQLRNAAPQMGFEPAAVAGRALAATTLALALNGATPSLTQAAVEPPAVVQQYGASMVADTDAELRDAQQKFLEQRAKMKTAYETDVESTYKSEEEVADKKNIYVTIVGGLVVVAFVAPMLQYFYYTGGE